MTPLRRRMLEELQRRNYSPETTRGYILAVKQFAEYFGRSPEKMGAEEVRRFQLYLLNEKKLAPGTVETRMAALRFLYKKVLKRRDLAYDDLIFPKTPEKLPVVLSQEEVKRLIEAAPNLLHRTLLMVLYSTGVRRKEASRLKVSDIDSQRQVIHIRQGKGSRDRDLPLTPKLLSCPPRILALEEASELSVSQYPRSSRSGGIDFRQDGLVCLHKSCREGRDQQADRPTHSPAQFCHPYPGSRR